ncbi:hypothetical protein DF268_38460 [Streptomyces sp. V2]|uniref:Secreted protein n=1 Tax=Streptomyces niveiscabiei TaxID=164115 RepID=A0ABW9HSH6_9ACTN|nr:MULTISPECIES: hypothetical protein [Streptomyces]PWG08335.1 hypothetical protein DF268_38460 [Streptomyces sp. V2]QZZ27970.1 hypothetical protein A7X85_18270 [Streptomyces sp. ST1015]
MRTRLATLAGSALLATATVLATSPAASAAETTTWQLTGVSPGRAKAAYVSSPTARGVCVQANNRWTDPVGGTITTLVFTNDSNCTGSAGTQCRTTVPSSPAGATRIFDVHSCRWVG